MRVKFAANDGGICSTLINCNNLDQMKLRHPDLEVVQDV